MVNPNQSFWFQQNLKANGGPLDEVIFLARTDNVDDLMYLDTLVETSLGYSRRNLTEDNHEASKVTYGQTWDVVERGTLYIKIDDDIVSAGPSACSFQPIPGRQEMVKFPWRHYIYNRG